MVFWPTGRRLPVKKLMVVLAVLMVAQAVACSQTATAPATTQSQPSSKFIRTFNVYQSAGKTLTVEDLPILAKFDVLFFTRTHFPDINGNTWAAVRAVNPNVQIFIYEQGPDVWQEDGGGDPTDEAPASKLNNIARFGNARGHSMGNLDKDNPDLFLLTPDGKRANTYKQPWRYLMDFGSPKFQAYWIEACTADVVKQPWAGDGIFVDNTSALIGGYESDLTAKYPTDDKWLPAMYSYELAVSKGMHAVGQKVWTNTCCTVDPRGYDFWLRLDADPDHPDMLTDEGAYATGYGEGNRFYPEEKWKRQVDIVAALKNSAPAMFCHTQLDVGGEGIDQYKKPVTYWQTLHYALGSFLLGKDDNRPAYFFFFTEKTPYRKIYYYDEYDRIDLGKALGPYQMTKVGEANIYWRPFERGYVYVNPSLADATAMPLPEPCKQFAHETINNDPSTLPDISSLALVSHHAAILLKSASLTSAAPAKP